ncbi:hypothetical protein [Thalassospira mesophila]|uniref:Uncharacterized protein n=1 Tax=Thalassospira mesophila TaxID=1293891 RepID=A0A1Y2L182_9PROT|nr:hypothetical protein [Thalassospira mesophila]OSQ38988.1 hypothetical protein TMES_09830 [Thalassospira mesophila]
MATIINLPNLPRPLPRNDTTVKPKPYAPVSGEAVTVILNRFPRQAKVIAALPNGNLLVRFTVLNQAQWITRNDILPPNNQEGMA